MNERSRNLLVGITALAGVVSFSFLLMMFGSFRSLTERGYTTYILFDETGGLNPNSRVRVSGIDVGRVDHLELTGDNKVLITAVIDEAHKDIPYNVGATIYQPLIGGSPALILEPPHGTATQPLAPDKKLLGQHSITDPIPGVMPATIGAVIAKFNDVSNNISDLTIKIARLSDSLSGVVQNIGDMTANRTLDEVKADPTKANIRTVIQRVDTRLAQLENVINGVDKFVNDDELLKNIKQTIANTNSVSAKLSSATDKVSAAADKYGELAVDSKERIDELAKRYVLVADDLSSAIRTAQKTIEAARDGQGTTGKLIKDPALYENLNDAVKRVDQTMVELKLLLQKWKAEGLPVKF